MNKCYSSDAFASIEESKVFSFYPQSFVVLLTLLVLS